MESALHKALLGYDGKSADFLGGIAAQFSSDPEYLNALTPLFGSRENNVSDGATWLFKHAVENGADLSAQTQSAFAQMALKTHTWAAQLHACQTVRFLSFTPQQVDALAKWLQPLLSHKRLFVRAWSLDALVSLSDVQEALMKEARVAVRAASRDASASVRARARQLEKSVFRV